MTAPTTSTLEVAAAHRQVQTAIRLALVADVLRLWPLLDIKRLDRTFPGWLQAMMTLTRSYHGQSALAAGRFYSDARRAASVPGATPVRLAPTPVAEWMARAYGYAGPGEIVRQTKLAASQARASDRASVLTAGTASRIVLDGGRDTTLATMHSDPVAVGFYRMTDGQPCAFCAMLAGRGVVYRNVGAADFKSHDHCGCHAEPAWSRSQALPDVSSRAAELWAESTRGQPDKVNAFRRAWEHQGT